MPTRVIVDANGQQTRETFEYTAEELAEQAANRQAAQAAANASFNERAELAAALEDLRPNENSMPVLKLKVNVLLEQVRLLRGL